GPPAAPPVPAALSLPPLPSSPGFSSLPTNLRTVTSTLRTGRPLSSSTCPSYRFIVVASLADENHRVLDDAEIAFTRRQHDAAFSLRDHQRHVRLADDQQRFTRDTQAVRHRQRDFRARR